MVNLLFWLYQLSGRCHLFHSPRSTHPNGYQWLSFNSSSFSIMFLNLVNAFQISGNEGSKSVMNRYILMGGFFLSLLQSFCKIYIDRKLEVRKLLPR